MDSTSGIYHYICMDVHPTVVYYACVKLIWLEIRKWVPLMSTRKRSDYSAGENSDRSRRASETAKEREERLRK